MRWDPAQYARFAEERARPFVDLMARIGHDCPRRVIDLGCGPGNLTALLARRWPGARVEGIDSSVDMIERAAALATDRLSFRVADLAGFRAPADADVIVSNAALQWVPNHRHLLRVWAESLPWDGWLAFQVPGNFSSPSHALMRALASSPRWAPLLGEVLAHHDPVSTPASYASELLELGLVVDAWETTYLHQLSGPDPVLEWVRGTGLRPVLAALSSTAGAQFEAEYAPALRSAYPAGKHGTMFPFRRVFVVAHRPHPHAPA
ncbi:MAG: trans-aconitate 2-methyltransferase [Actinomycetota bacterium]|nr:trans-aconitate 2-methyltransferase [Actinomycetota bacterium]MDP9166526.1 trans-aconitate 2-methyltransferase [Actinomycetota bacterium]